MSTLVIVCATATVQAQVAATHFHIPAQPLADSLRALGRESNINLLFDPRLVAGRHAPALNSEITLDAALTALLAGTDITYEFLNEKTVVLAATADQAFAGAQGTDRLLMARDTSTEGKEPATDADNQLEEIVVTAQRREERLIDTPISIGVLSGRQLDRSSARGVTDVLAQIGGVSMIEDQPGHVQIAVRGILSGGSGTGGAGSSPTAYYQDEVPFPSVGASWLPDTNAFDLARVEVLRGPQGTLYGASALGGVVRVLSNEANLEAFEAKSRVRTSGTQDGGINYGSDLAVNVPLIPGTLAIRGVVSYSDLSGFIASSLDGTRRINDAQAQAFRAKVNYQASDSLSMKLTLSRSKIDTGAPSFALDDFTTPFPAHQPAERIFVTYNVLTEYKWSNVSLLSSTSYLDYQQDANLEFLLSGLTALGYLDRGPLRSFSQEFRFVSQLDGPWRWSAGSIYTDTTQRHILCCYVPFQPLFPFPSSETDHSKSHAIFGEVTRSFAGGRFDLTAGLRYFQDQLVTTEYSRFTTGTAALIVPKVTDFDHLTGRLLLDYKPRKDSMFYASVATGFRSGLNQLPSVIAVAPTFGSLNPDSLITFELGTKGRKLGGALTYDIAVYYTDWKDIQQSLVLPIGFVALLNAGRASGTGMDTGLSYQPTPDLTLQASIGWNDMKFDRDYSREGVVLFAKGTRLNESPEWTGSVGAKYATPTPWTCMRAVLSSNFAYGSRRSFRYLTGSVLSETQSDNMTDLKASAGIEGDRWSLDITGDNLLDDAGARTGPSVDSAFTGIRQRPRTIGLQASFKY